MLYLVHEKLTGWTRHDLNKYSTAPTTGEHQEIIVYHHIYTCIDCSALDFEIY